MLVGFCHLQPRMLTNKGIGTGQETLKLLGWMDGWKEGREGGKEGEKGRKEGQEEETKEKTRRRINKGGPNLSKNFMCGR